MSTTLKIFNGDVVIGNVTGRPVSLSKKDKLTQDTTELLTISVQPSGFGSGLDDLIGLIPLDQITASGLIYIHVNNSLEAWKKLQRIDKRIPRDSEEKYHHMTNLKVEQDSSDKSKYFLRLNIVSEAGLPISIPIVVLG